MWTVPPPRLSLSNVRQVGWTDKDLGSHFQLWKKLSYVLVFLYIFYFYLLDIPVFFPGFSGGSDGEESTCNLGDLGWIPGLGRSPGGGHGNPLQSSCLENPHGERSVEGYVQSMGWQRIRYDWATKHSTIVRYYQGLMQHVLYPSSCIANPILMSARLTHPPSSLYFCSPSPTSDEWS